MRSVLAVVAFVALVFAATPSVADVTIQMTTSTTSGGVTSTLSTVIYIKGMKARIDIKGKGQGISILQDVAARQQLMVNHDTKRVRTYDPNPREAGHGGHDGRGHGLVSSRRARRRNSSVTPALATRCGRAAR